MSPTADPELIAAGHPRGVQRPTPGGRPSPAESEGSLTPVLPEPGAALVRDPARPNPAELTRCRLQAINPADAVGHGDYAPVFQLTPRTVADAAYLSTALAEVAADLIRVTGRDPAEVVDELRGSAIRHQSTGGRPVDADRVAVNAVDAKSSSKSSSRST